MIDMKEAWDSGHPDKITSVKASWLKELHNACEWYAASNRTKFPRGFKMRAKALERELRSRRNRTATWISIAAAVVALLSALASLYGALRRSPAQDQQQAIVLPASQKRHEANPTASATTPTNEGVAPPADGKP